MFGFVLNRLNVCITGFEAAQGGRYLPSWEETAITLMVVAGVFAIYRFAARVLPVFPEAEVSEPEFRVLRPATVAPTARLRGTAAG